MSMDSNSESVRAGTGRRRTTCRKSERYSPGFPGRRKNQLTFTSLILILALAACGKKGKVTPKVKEPPGEKPRSSCELFSGTMTPADTIRVVLTDRISSEHAPLPRNTGEEILFDHLYGTLTTLDCEGRLLPALAESWSYDARDRSWRFVVSEKAVFWYGTPVKAAHVIESWNRTCDDATLRAAGIDSAVAVDARILRIYVSDHRNEFPRILAEPPFAVALWPFDTVWPLGSGPYQLEPSEQVRIAYMTETIDIRSSPKAGGPLIQFIQVSEGDVRDLMPEAADVIVSSAPDVIEYASEIPHLAVKPLPWEVTYVLLSPARLQEIRSGSSFEELPDDLLNELAVNAVRAPARGFRPPVWWEILPECPLAADRMEAPHLPPDLSPVPGVPRIVYDSGDPVARDLSERIIAVIMADPSISPGSDAFSRVLPLEMLPAEDIAVVGMVEPDLSLSLRRGVEFAYIVPVSRRVSSPCYEWNRLIADVPWLGAGEIDPGISIVPLIDVRRFIIADERRVRITVDWKGTIRIGR